jgi:hypothetical protein
LKALTDALMKHFGSKAGAQAVTSSVQDDDVAVGDPPAWLEEFKHLLEEGNFVATDLWQARQVELGGHIGRDQKSKITRALENFDFDAALVLVRDEQVKTV